MVFSAPHLLTEHHQLDDFSSGVSSLDDWLKRRALANQETGATRTYVLCDDQKVMGYYALAAGAINHESTPGHFRRNMPNPIPVTILARLAIDSQYQGKGLGRSLFRDTAYRVVNAADTIGIRGIIVHALSENAKAFYGTLGFEPSPLDSMTLMITLSDLRAAIS